MAIDPISLIGSLGVMVAGSIPLNAEICTPLRVVGGEGTEITKTVSPPGIVLTKSNWNTDFAVPSNTAFPKYIAIVRSESSKTSNLPVEMFLKYSNGTFDKTFDGTVELLSGQSKEIIASPRLDRQPYQINLKVGGITSQGFSYTLSVLGCW